MHLPHSPDLEVWLVPGPLNDVLRDKLRIKWHTQWSHVGEIKCLDKELFGPRDSIMEMCIALQWACFEI
jgi:hypothetical protein